MKILMFALAIMAFATVPAHAQSYGYDGTNGRVDRQYVPVNPALTPGINSQGYSRN